MPDKPNENRIMAMLERRGIVRKTDSEDELTEDNPNGEHPDTETDIRAILGQSVNDGPKITPAPRQPVPGIITPIMPGAQSQQSPSSPTQTIRHQEPERPQQPVRGPEPERQAQPVRSQAPEQTQQSVRSTEPERQAQPASHQAPEQPQTTRPPAPVPLQGAVHQTNSPAHPANAAAVATAFPGAPTAAADSAAGGKPPETRAETYTDRYLEVDGLYEALSIKSNRTDSIYLVEEYLKTLPDSLPDESRRDIVIKIVAASGFDFDRLMGDGVLRVRMLKEYAERFAQYTEDYVSARHAELDELEHQIMRIRALIEARRELHKKQFFTIEAEAQRLKEILTFISG